MPVSWPQLQHSDHIKSVLRKCNKQHIPESDLERLAADRESWSLACATRLTTLTAISEQAASEHRARRRVAVKATPAGSVCPQCGRIYGSDFSLRTPQSSHLRSHQRLQNRRHRDSTASSSKYNWPLQASKQ